MFKSFLKLVLVSGFVFTSAAASAATLDFKGGYRFEWNEVDNTNLSSNSGRKSYLTNFLYIAPEFVAADGVNIVTRFDIVTAGSIYENTYVGSLWGGNGRFGVTNPQGTLFSGNKGNLEMKASQLYLKVNQEYGQIILGRAPFEFGMGMTYNAGQGEFDHFYHNRDMAAYKVMIGDTTIMPIITRMDDADFGQGQSSGSTGFLLQYENSDSRSKIAFYKEDLKGPNTSNNFPTTNFPILGQTNKSVKNAWSLGRTSFFLSRGWDFMTFKLEGGFLDGTTGIVDQATSKEVDLKSYGVALELDFPRPENKLSYNVKAGIASGDDPGTVSYEGYLYDRNYNVAMLMFNHRLGQYDIFGSSPGKSTTLIDNSQSVDDEFVSNTAYFAPKVTYVVNDRMKFNSTLVFAQIINNAKNSRVIEKDLGIELDTELVYKFTDNVTWVNQLGILFPGKAWRFGPSGVEYENANTYGFASKAAISF